MFVTTRDAGVRRRSRVYSNSKAARSSRISLLTISTTNSGGSNSTITQESYDRTHRSRRRRPRDSRSHRLSDPAKESVDVFDFLVDEKSKSKESLSSLQDVATETPVSAATNEHAEHDHHEDEPEVMIRLDDPDPEGFYRSMSDSGISMGSASSSSAGKHCQLPAVPEELNDRPTSRPFHGNEMALFDPRWQWPATSPQPWPEGFVPPPCPAPPPAVMYDLPMVQPYPYPPYTPPYGTPPTRSVGDDDPGPHITIREPSDQLSKPACFRSFSKVTTRLLLQMQDDIAELEDELKELDLEVDQATADCDHDSASADDRKRERKLREGDIYRNLHEQLDQYYHALEMQQKVERISEPALTSDLPRYHDWLRERIREEGSTRRLVSNDLRRFSLVRQSASATEYAFQPQYLAYAALVNAVLPLIVFKVIAGVLNRLIILSLVVVISCVAQEKLHPKVGRDELACTLLCISISAFAAICL